MKRGLALAFVWAGVLWGGAALAGETRGIIEMDVSPNQVVTGRDFLLLPDPEQVALVWGIIVGQEGLILRSRDRGRTWSQVLPPLSRSSS